MLMINGEAMRRIRIQREMSQAELSLEADISISIISCIENGKNTKPKIQTIERLAEALQISEDEILIRS
jgi:transcriptional regulator with XRE-family HTH domain